LIEKEIFLTTAAKGTKVLHRDKILFRDLRGVRSGIAFLACLALRRTS
jgi:hypothetical protein